MSLDVYYPSDILSALRAAEFAAATTAGAVTGGKHTPFSLGFLIGYRAALVTLALFFGLSLPGSEQSALLGVVLARAGKQGVSHD